MPREHPPETRWSARRKRDLVEEFWDGGTLELCRERAAGVGADDFLDELSAMLGASGRIWAAPSGTAALRELLAQVVPARRPCVLVCSFNCRLVADAVLQAGRRVETFDLADTCGRIDWWGLAARIGPRHGALVVPHLFGVPSDFRVVRAVAASAGVVVVEDCAHTVGGTIGGACAGTLGDAAIFSFNYDKPISLGGGGALLVNNADLWPSLRFDWPRPSLERDASELSCFLRYLRARRDPSRRERGPAARALSRALARLHPQRPFPVTGIGPLRAALGLWQLRRYPDVMSQRNARATFFTAKTGCSWYAGPDIRPAWLKQKAAHPSLLDGPGIASALRHRGLPVGTFNWSRTIDQHLGNPVRPNAAHVARHGLDVPIHQNMGWAELGVICEAFGGGRWAAPG
jgi:dTDP-4-amino-4,6-dideoxygalactose transaminase